MDLTPFGAAAKPSAARSDAKAAAKPASRKRGRGRPKLNLPAPRVPPAPHQTVPVLVWVDVDIAVAPIVRFLNGIPGIRTHSSCQGTIGEKGPAPYGPYVLISWRDDTALEEVSFHYEVRLAGDHLAYVSDRAAVHK